MKVWFIKRKDADKYLNLVGSHWIKYDIRKVMTFTDKYHAKVYMAAFNSKYQHGLNRKDVKHVG